MCSDSICVGCPSDLDIIVLKRSADVVSYILEYSATFINWNIPIFSAFKIF